MSKKASKKAKTARMGEGALKLFGMGTGSDALAAVTGEAPPAPRPRLVEPAAAKGEPSPAPGRREPAAARTEAPTARSGAARGGPSLAQVESPGASPPEGAPQRSPRPAREPRPRASWETTTVRFAPGQLELLRLAAERQPFVNGKPDFSQIIRRLVAEWIEKEGIRK